MATEIPAPGPDSGVTTTAVAANLRILSVKLDGAERQTANVPDLMARVDRIVELFLEKHWRPPRRSLPILPLSYLLYPGPDDRTFGEDVDALTAHLERHLFGEGVEIKCLIGEEGDIAQLSRESELVFRDAHEAAGRSAARPDEDTAGPRRAVRLPSPRDAAWIGRLRLFAGYDALRSAVLCYMASLGQGDFPSALVDYDDLAHMSGARLEDIELATLRFSARKILDQARTGAAVCYCLAPLSYETLADRRRREAYLKEGAALPDDLRKYILPSVFGGPSGTSSSHLMEIVSALRVCFANVDWRTRSCAVDIQPLKHAQLFSTTLVLPSGSQARTLELTRLPEFVRRLSALRLRSGVTGVMNRDDLDAVLAARAHYLSGPAVSHELPTLAPRAGLSDADLPLAA
jgi:hypothetical protein